MASAALDIVDKAKPYFFTTIQILDGFFPDGVTKVLSIITTINQMTEDKQQYNELLDIFYLNLDSALKILEVNQFHDKYNSGKAKIEELINKISEDVKALSEQHGLIKRVVGVFKASTKLDDLRKDIEAFNLLKGIFPQTQSFDIRNQINDLKAASFWNNHFGNSTDRDYNTLKDQLGKRQKNINGLLEEIQPVTKTITMGLFNYVVSWLGGWDKFAEYIVMCNPFTKEFFENASKEIKPPVDLNISKKDGNEYEIKPGPMAWFSEDGKKSASLSYILYYRGVEKGQAAPNWEIVEIDPNSSAVITLDTKNIYTFKVFSVLKDKNMISNEYTGKTFVPTTCKVKNIKPEQVKTAWISPDRVALSGLPKKKSPIFESLYKKSWELCDEKDTSNYKVESMRPVIYVSKAAYSLAMKLGYFFSPEILFSLWKDPLHMKESSFAKKLLGGYYDEETAKNFVYTAILKYNNEFSKYIQMEFPEFKAIPICDEKKYESASSSFASCDEDFKKKTDAECMKFSKELGLVVLEYLRDKVVRNLCKVGAQSNIQGYLASPSKHTMDGFKPGYIIVLDQTLLGNMNTFISKVNIESDSLTYLSGALTKETFRLAGENFYREVSKYIYQENMDIWTNPDAKSPVPSVFLPGQIPLSFTENKFNVKIGSENVASPDALRKWMELNPPQLKCIGSNFKMHGNVKCIIDFTNGIEFFARGNFTLEFKSNDSAKASWAFNVFEGNATIMHNTKGNPGLVTCAVLPKGIYGTSYVGYQIVNKDGAIIFKCAGHAPFEIASPTTGIANYSLYFSMFGNDLDIVNLHNVGQKKPVKDESSQAK